MEEKNDVSQANSKWTGMVPVDDTALAVTDTGGPGIPVVYLNGQFATQGYWRKVIADLGPGFRHITYDERARGKKSKKSADYSSPRACATSVPFSRPGAWTGHWWWAGPTERSSRRTGPAAIRDRALGAALVDGAYPYDWLDEAMEQRIRKLFRRLGWFMPLLRPTGLTPRMNAEQMANLQHRARRDRPRARAGPRAGQHHRPGAVCGCFGGRTRKGGGGRTDTYQPRWGDRSQPEHQDQCEGRRQTRWRSCARTSAAIAEAVREVAALDRGEALTTCPAGLHDQPGDPGPWIAEVL